VILLVAKSYPRVLELRANGFNVGRLLGPRDRKPAVEGIPWAADNDAFNGFDERRFRSMLAALEGVEGCLFVSAPDVVGDYRSTRDLYVEWAPIITGHGLPVAYVLQDGEDGSTVPEDCAAVFIGGTTGYKMGDRAASAAHAAKADGKWLHMGRVNTMPRIRYAHSLGVDSIDGTKWSKYLDTWRHQLRVLPFRQEAFQ
jgi:hypothetical protein